MKPNWLEKLVGETQVRLLFLLRRSHRTITELAQSLGLTDNAVRTHVAALGRDGLVEQVGTQRDTGGKPARMYRLTTDGEELFPKAYSIVLRGLVEELVRTNGRDHAITLLRGVGAQVAKGVVVPGGVDARINAAADALRGLGGDIEIRRSEQGWLLQGFACPLSAVTSHHAEVCSLAAELVEQITGQPVVECCTRGDRPRCSFQVGASR